MTLLLEVDELVAGYGEGRVLDGFSLRLGEGERLALLGRNGAGKSTFLKTLMGLLPPRGGAIRFAGRRIDGRRPHEIARLGIGYVPQGREIFADFTVLENLRLGDLEARDFDELFALFPVLAERRDAPAGGLSGGQQQQLAIARALVRRPRLLLLDEPSEGVQPSIVAEIAERLREISRRRGTALLLVEQNLELALDLCTRAAVVEGGRVVAEHGTAELAADPAVVDRFLAL